jgi:hypothetical protein
MGGLFSTNRATEADWEQQRAWQAQATPEPPLVPPEVDENAGIYAFFLDPVKVVPHRDGTCLVAYAGKYDRDYPDEPNPWEVKARDAHEFLLRAVGAEDPEKDGGDVHPRIVKLVFLQIDGYHRD